MKITMQGIEKSFGANSVLRDVSFSVAGGEICALLGENGAGKSTLMNILGGVHRPDKGSICLDGREVRFRSPVDSLDAGIAFIHQELNLVNDLTVYENLFLTHLPSRHGVLDAAGMKRQTRALFERMNLDIDPSAMVRDLDASYKQIVEIARALLQKASIIIMDEPTTSLTGPEIARVFAMMRTLRETGVGIVFISHKLGEVMEICDRYTVLRDGHMVREGAVSDTNPRELAAAMVGHDVQTGTTVRSRPGEEVLRLDGLSDGKHFHDVSLTVRAGEVLGVTGLLGDGRSELFGTVFGAYGTGYTGRITLCGKEIHPASTHEALGHGIALLPRNRKENAILKDMSVLDNGTIVRLPRFRKGPFIDEPGRRAAFAGQVEELRIRMGSADDPITSLSGGNQQKVILAKWLMSDPRLLILDNPTQGVDVGAKEEIYAIIRRLAEAGTAVVVLSSEAQEIIRVCDRAIVMFHGRCVGEATGDDMNETNLMFLATGGRGGEEGDPHE